MNCQPCNSSGFPLSVQNVQSIYTPYCASTPVCTEPSDIKSYKYNGPDLTCSNVTTGLNMEEVVQRLNDAICGAVGDYSTYNVSCLANPDPILTQQDFVERISDFVCVLRTEFDTFKNTTFPTYQTSVDARFDAIEIPGIVNSTAGTLVTDSIQTVLTKYGNKLTDIQTVRLDLSSVTWDECFVIGTPPTTIAGGFNLIVDQICSLKTDIGNISPSTITFNNTGSCLPGALTAADSLTDTVNKIKTRLCQSPTFDINALTWGCTTKPNSNTTDLQNAFQSVLSQLTFLKQNLPIFDAGDFTVTNVDNGNLCQGKTVALAGGGGGGGTDRYVATNVGDLTPGTLSSKLVEGANIDLDYLTSPGQLIISSTAVGADVKVKSRSADPTSGYLEEKLKAASDSGITITPVTDTGDNKIAITPTIDPFILFDALLDAILSDVDLRTKFCERVTACLPDCIIPPNVTVIYDTSVNVPAPPTNPVVDDTANTFNWTNSPSFTSVTDYEQTLDGGLNYTPLTAKPITGLTGNRAAGQVGVRVKAIGSNPPSLTLTNSTAYTT